MRFEKTKSETQYDTESEGKKRDEKSNSISTHGKPF